MIIKQFVLSLAVFAMLTPSLVLASENSQPTVRTVVERLSADACKTALSAQFRHASGECIGEALYDYTKDNTATLHSLFIYETYRQQGYGSKLFRLVCTMLKKKGCTILTWNACPFTYLRNDQPLYLSGLVEFFEKLGARIVKYQDHVRGMPTTAVMAIDL